MLFSESWYHQVTPHVDSPPHKPSLTSSQQFICELEQFFYTHAKVQEVQLGFKTSRGQQSISK